MNFDNIPDEMKALNQWACFRTKWNEQEGKYKKIIISPRTGKFAFCNDPATWATFEEAKSYCLRYKFQGLTFALTKDITFIDIDHAVNKDTGEILSQEAVKLLELLPDTFTEKSVSGSGVHILMRGSLPENALKRNDSKGLEFYDTKRFICMTGDLLNGCTTLKDYSDKIADINYSFIGKRKERTFHSAPCSRSDTDLIETISNSRQGAKFQSLYQGNTGSYQSHSNADFAFASILAWWTQDGSQIDRIFRSSGLMREKWDRRVGGSTYGANLIDAAIGVQPTTTYRSAGYEM